MTKKEAKGKIFNKWVYVIMGLMVFVYGMVAYLIVATL